MLNSLEIRNYRNLKELKIDSLKRINLITGKNNTGKSTLLEAIAIYATRCDLNLIYELLKERGDYYRLNELNKNVTEDNIVSLTSLFTERSYTFSKTSAIKIGSIDGYSVGIRFINYIQERTKIKDQEPFTTKRIVENIPVNQLGEYKTGLQIRAGTDSYIVSLDEDTPGFRVLRESESLQFIRTRNIDRESNGKLWDTIALTEKEKYVIESLKIIESKTEKITFIEEYTRKRIAVIKLAGYSDVLPLKSMGDGINRILTIILALIASEDGFLLLDEFENGLHYSVQEKLWEIIFKLSGLLKVQVFATTYSNDCIKGFEKILNINKNKEFGKLIRLEEKGGKIMEVEYNAEELKIATDHNIETR